MLKRLLTGSLAVLVLSCALPVSAGFVHQDFKTVGDKKTTLHEETGIEWLTLKETIGLSLDDVSKMLGVGGKFDGWRFPTSEEVESVLSAIIPISFNNSTPDAATVVNPALDTHVNAWFEWMGFVASSRDVTNAFGMHKATTKEGSVLISGAVKPFPRYLVYEDYLVGYSTSFSNSAYGVFLVRGSEVVETPGGANDVPAPLPVALLGFCAIFFAAWRGCRVTK